MKTRAIEDGATLGLIAVIAVLAFIFDISVPLGVAGGIPYIIIVVLGLRLSNPYWILGLAGIGTLLTLAGYYASDPGGVEWMVLTNRGLALFVIWSSAVLAFSLQRKLRKALTELENQKYVLDHHAIVSTMNVAGQFVYANEKFCEISGYSLEELAGHQFRILKSGVHSRGFIKQMWQTISGGNVWHGELCGKTKDGSLYWVDSTIAPLFNEQGKISQYITVQTDVTDRKKTEELLRQAQKMEALGELTGGIAHDFNNLLGVIIGNLDLMKIKVDQGSKLLRQIEKAQNAALRGSELTHRLLNFSHQSPEASSPVNANKSIRSLKELIGKSLTANISVDMSLSEDLWMAELDAGDFEDAIINLSLNARDAMPDGGRLIIETKNLVMDSEFASQNGGLVPGEYVEITFSDTGLGMAKEITDKIFEPFFTTKAKGKGTGLGLAMVYGFVQRSKGNILVYSEEGAGTTFRIFLPRSLTASEQTEQPIVVETSLPAGAETVLIVDDEEELAAIAESILRGLGYTTLCAYSGEEALKFLESNPTIDLLFSDVVMPGSISGFDLAKAARKMYPAIKVLLTSGFPGKMQHSPEAIRWAKGMVQKPYRHAELAKRVRETLDSGN